MRKKLSWNPDARQSLNPIWTFGVNTCHAALWLRDDLPFQLKQIHRSLKMRHLRCHGILNDDMVVCNKDGTFDFTKAVTALKRMRNAGYLPFLELSSMPGSMARGNAVSTVYRFRCDPPANWDRWRALIRGLIRTLTAEFGVKELSKWYFEVWNEPDLDPWFWVGTREEYFRLYDIARNEIKTVSENCRVGGPATSRTMWIKEFLEHCSRSTQDDPSGDAMLRCDFISTHAYPNDTPFLESGVTMDVKRKSAAMLRTMSERVRCVMNEAGAEHLPLFIGEWNSSSGPISWNHDECGNAPFICKCMAELSDICQGSLYWNASDIYEECGFHYTPFHGGYGLISVNGIKKSSFHAFRFMAQLRGKRIACSLSGAPCEEHGVFAAMDHCFLRVLIWNYCSPDTDGLPLELQVSTFKGDALLESILPKQGSAYELWREDGCFDFPTNEKLKLLEQASQCSQKVISSKETIFLPPGTAAILTLHRSNI